jgi:hypothetical protein
MTAARWPDTLPAPQADSLKYDGGNTLDVIDVLSGPARARLARRNAGGNVEFAVWMTAEQTEAFEVWYADTIKNHDGELYAPWFGHGVVLAFVNEYDLKPQGRGWQLGAVLVELYVDPSLCDEHLSAIFGGVLRDPGNVADIFKADLTSVNIYRDDYSLDLIASEVC